MDLFTQLSLIIIMAAAIAGVMKLLKQPLVIGYIITGLIIGPLVIGLVDAQHPETIGIFSELGIASLLFIVGLHFSPHELKDLGKSAFLIGLVQVILTVVLGFGVALAFGFSYLPAFYLGLALCFSSTIVVLKFLSDRHDLDSLYGRISVGILLFQDIVATLVLVAAAAFSQEGSGINIFLLLIIKGLIVTLVLSLISYYVLPKLSTFFARSQEYLFLFAVAWGFGLSALFSYLGFSIEIGALVAGVVLSVSPYSEEISSKLRPLRDFFVVMFFILLGARISLENSSGVLVPALVFSGLALLAKPFIIMVLMGLFKYKKKPGFFASISLSQISEFSLILALLGLGVGHIQEDVFSLITLTGIISIAVSTYLMNYSHPLYAKLSGVLGAFERKNTFEEIQTLGSYDVILFGCNRTGYDFIEAFKDLETGFLAVDFDPDIVTELLEEGINVKYGDADDGEFLEDIRISEAKVIVSTIPDYETSMQILSKANPKDNEVSIILTSHNIDDALVLYEHGADYVIVPHFIGGQVVSRLAKEAVFGDRDLRSERERHYKYLKQREKLGHNIRF